MRLIPVLFPLLLVAGCGDEAGRALRPADGTPEEQVTAVVEHYFE